MARTGKGKGTRMRARTRKKAPVLTEVGKTLRAVTRTVKTALRPNPGDLTPRNNNARKNDIALLREQYKILKARVDKLERTTLKKIHVR